MAKLPRVMVKLWHNMLFNVTRVSTSKKGLLLHVAPTESLIYGSYVVRGNQAYHTSRAGELLSDLSGNG